MHLAIIFQLTVISASWWVIAISNLLLVSFLFIVIPTSFLVLNFLIIYILYLTYLYLDTIVTSKLIMKVWNIASICLHRNLVKADHFVLYVTLGLNCTLKLHVATLLVITLLILGHNRAGTIRRSRSNIKPKYRYVCIRLLYGWQKIWIKFHEF